MDQEAVSLTQNLQAKKKKKKVKKKINPNAFMGQDGDQTGMDGQPQGFNMRQSTLINAGNSIGGGSSSNRGQPSHYQSQPQEQKASDLPDLDLDLDANSNLDGNDGPTNLNLYDDFNNGPQADNNVQVSKPFDINNLKKNESMESDELL